MIKDSLKFIPGRSGEKVLLILGGHRSHVSVGLVVDWAKTHDIILCIIPAHTSQYSTAIRCTNVACYGLFLKMFDFQCHKLIGLKQ